MLKSTKYLTQLILNQRFALCFIVSCISTFLIIGCSSSRLKYEESRLNSNLKTKKEHYYFSGILVIDPESGDTLVQQNKQKYFTPASNVKIFELYVGMKMLPEKLPRFKYLEQNDTLFLMGTGDPTFLHPDFLDKSTVSFLKSKKQVAFYLGNYDGNRYRPGWAWEDFDTYFSPELTPLALYGNVVRFTQKDSIKAYPLYFKENIFRGYIDRLRDERVNRFYLPYTTDTLDVPFITSHELTQKLLEKELKKEIALIKEFPEGAKKTFAVVPTDSVLKKMMFDSDNFIAEQLALLASSMLSDTISFERSRNYVLDGLLADLRQEPRWVDGSGLSRYNLFTPESMVQVLSKLYAEFPKNRLFHLFPYWDENGTIKKPKANDPMPFIIAKSGSLGNNYNLSGYLFTKSGKILIFSYMNNHFKKPSAEIRKEIKAVLQTIHDNH